MSKSVQDLEQDLAAAKAAEADKHRAARDAEQAAAANARRLEELKAERQATLDGIAHLKGKIDQRQKRVAEIDAEIKEAE